MPRGTVFVTRIIHDAGLSILSKAGLGLRMFRQFRPPSPGELLGIVATHDAVLCQLRDRIDEPVLSAAAQGGCRIIASAAAGYDNIDIAAARRHGVIVTHTPGVLTEAVADLTWALLLAAARRVGEAERFIRAEAWRGWSMLEFMGADVHGKSLGIVGAGRIGAAVARRATGFSMNVRYFNTRPRPELETAGAKQCSLNELLAESDFVSLHVPLTEKTRHMIDERAIGLMKRSAILINTARGEIIDQPALIEALRTGRIAAAGLDVFENEPQIDPELYKLENVVLLPHIGSATESTRRGMAEMAARNIVAVLKGERPLNPTPGILK
ncbi:MAG TPA: D-glycerate dehydrogenase [Phycisphaerae bacterium]|nr:D-glycerate dehydrogenase [Phycisphaerae bacterium]